MQEYDFVGRVARFLASAPRERRERKRFKCFLCKDVGLVEYIRIINHLEYRYFAHCCCEKGICYSYDGSLCREKSEYRMASVEEILGVEGMEALRAENQRVWEAAIAGFDYIDL